MNERQLGIPRYRPKAWLFPIAPAYRKRHSGKWIYFRTGEFRADVRGEHGDLPLVGFTFFEGLDFLDVDNIVRLHAEGLSYDDGAKFV